MLLRTIGARRVGGFDERTALTMRSGQLAACAEAVRRLVRCLWRVPAVLSALAVVALVVPVLPARGGLRHGAVRSFCRVLAGILGLRVTSTGAPVSGPCLISANHVSWLDICLIAGTRHCNFVAKSEVRGWPLFGGLAARLDTCFIHRGNKFACYRSLPVLQAHLRDGPVVIFPEGTTTLGASVGPWHPMLFEAAIREAVPMQPVSLVYRSRDGGASRAAAYIDDDSLVGSLLRIMCEPRIDVFVDWHAPVHAGHRSVASRTCRAASAAGIRRRLRPADGVMTQANSPTVHRSVTAA